METLLQIFDNKFELDSFREYTLALIFLKHVSQNKTASQTTPAKPEIKVPFTGIYGRRMEIQCPSEIDFFTLYRARQHPDISDLVDIALLKLEALNHQAFKQNGLASLGSIVSYSKKQLSHTQRNKIVKSLLERINHSSFTALQPKQQVGYLFKQLLEKLYSTATNDQESVYVSSYVTKLITGLIDPHPGESIYDPKCGTGHLLISCGKYIQQQFSSCNYQLYGQEAHSNTWAIAKLNMHIHGENINAILHGDYISTPRYTFSENQLSTFDVVLSSAPFPIENWNDNGAKKDLYKRFRRGIPPRGKGDWALILHMIESMTPTTGRMAIHISQGTLFREASEWTIRKKLIDENLLEAVIGIPEKLTNGGMPPTVILLFKRNRKKRDILFINGNRIAASKNIRMHSLDEQLEKIITLYKCWQPIDDVSYIATWDEVRKNNYNLSLHRYINSFNEEFLDLHHIRHERTQLKREYNAIENEIDHVLSILSSTQDKEDQ